MPHFFGKVKLFCNSDLKTKREQNNILKVKYFRKLGTFFEIPRQNLKTQTYFENVKTRTLYEIGEQNFEIEQFQNS